MEQRFEQLFTLQPNLYIEQSPIIIAAGVLLKDNESGKIIVQLKFHSVDNKPIKALKIELSMYDVTQQRVDGTIKYQYLDLDIKNGQEFGDNRAIVLDNEITRSFKIENITVVFSDDTTQDISGTLEPLPIPSNIDTVLENENTIIQYQLMVSKKAYFVPQKVHGLWECSCGKWNSSDKCSECGANKDATFNLLNNELLSKYLNERLAKEEADRIEKERIFKLEQQKKDQKRAERNVKIRKILKIIPIICIVIIAIVAGNAIHDFSKKNTTYKSAIELQEKGNDEKALYAFSDIPDFKDSSEYMKSIINKLVFNSDDISIRRAVKLLKAYPAGNEDLLQLCEKIYSVEDNLYSFSDIYGGTYYFNADYYLDNGTPYADVQYTNYLGEIKKEATVKSCSDSGYVIYVIAKGTDKSTNNSSDIVFEVGVKSATAQINGYSKDTLVCLEKMNKEEYLPRAEREKQYPSMYESATKLLEKKEYDQAIEIYKQIIDYKDSRDKITEAEYGIADQLFQEGDNYDAARAFYELGDYKDSWNRCFEIWGKVTERKTLDASNNNTVAVKADGTVVGTGANFYGELGFSDWTDIVAISEGDRHTVGLKADGTVVAVGDHTWCNDDRIEVSFWKDIVAISAGYSHTVGLKADGTVVAVGDNIYDQCDVENWYDIVQVVAGENCTLGLKADGTVVTTGSAESKGYQCDVEDWENIVSIDSHDSCTVGIKTDGTIVRAGFERGNQGTDTWTDIISASVNDGVTIGLKSDGTVLVTDVWYEVPNGNNIVDVCAGDRCLFALKSDCTVVATSDEYGNSNGQCNVEGWNNIRMP